MARSHVDHGDIVRFAQDKVNLPREKASEYRAPARRLIERIPGQARSIHVLLDPDQLPALK